MGLRGSPVRLRVSTRRTENNNHSKYPGWKYGGPRVEIRGTLDINSQQFATVPDAKNPHKQRPFAYFAYIRSNWQQIASLQLLTEGL
jgi:hypothetical protein